LRLKNERFCDEWRYYVGTQPIAIINFKGMRVPLLYKINKQRKDSVMLLHTDTLFMAMELSKRNWRLCFGDGQSKRQVVVVAGNRGDLLTGLSLFDAKNGYFHGVDVRKPQ
jgi:hypothetical protein